MMNIGLYYNVKKGKEEEFEKLFKGVIEKLKTPRFGVINARLYKDVENNNEYLIYSEWKDLDSFKAFMQSEEFHETTKLGRDLIDGTPKHRLFSELK